MGPSQEAARKKRDASLKRKRSVVEAGKKAELARKKRKKESAALQKRRGSKSATRRGRGGKFSSGKVMLSDDDSVISDESGDDSGEDSECDELGGRIVCDDQDDGGDSQGSNDEDEGEEEEPVGGQGEDDDSDGCGGVPEGIEHVTFVSGKASAAPGLTARGVRVEQVGASDMASDVVQSVLAVEKKLEKRYTMTKEMKRIWTKLVRKTTFRDVKFGKGLDLKEEAADLGAQYMTFRRDKVTVHEAMLEKGLKNSITDVRNSVVRAIKNVYRGKKCVICYRPVFVLLQRGFLTHC
jgi:hypothetical protein